MDLETWLAKQGRGAASALARATGLSYPTIINARRGADITVTTARLISDATGGAVSIDELCPPASAKHSEATPVAPVDSDPTDGAATEVG